MSNQVIIMVTKTIVSMSAGLPVATRLVWVCLISTSVLNLDLVELVLS